MVSDIILNRKLDILLSEMGIDSDTAYDISIQDKQPGICVEEKCDNIIKNVDGEVTNKLCQKCNHQSIMSLRQLLFKFV